MHINRERSALSDKELTSLTICGRGFTQKERNVNKKLQELNVKSSLLFGMGMLLLIGGIAIAVMAMAHNNLLLEYVSLIPMIGAMFCVVKALELTNQAHDIELQIGHVHAPDCKNNEVVTVVDQKKHYVPGGGGSWGGGIGGYAIDSETTECQSCHSRTVFNYH